MVARDEFLGYLKDALGHLHNADRLRRSPLANLFGISEQFDVAARLRALLNQGIQSLKPGADDAASEQAWRVFDSLFCCYVQQLSQRVAADQLGISPRQLRREQRIALESLADVLWTKIVPRDRPEAEGREMPTEAPAGPVDAGLSEELTWLRESSPTGPTDLRQQLRDALALVEPLAHQHRVRIRTSSAVALPATSVHPVALSQLLLSLLSVAIGQSPVEGSVQLATKVTGWQTEIALQSDIGPGPRSMSDDDSASLRMSHRLADLCGARLSVSSQADAFHATLSLPGYQQLPVLAIDDNADALQLMRRYVSHTQYRLISTQDPLSAIDLTESEGVEIIVLDVMMPNQDGWHVLAQLRQHPKTCHVPVIVCTILPEKALAVALGASGFIRKPVTREAFLAALDRQSELMGPEFR